MRHPPAEDDMLAEPLRKQGDDANARASLRPSIHDHVTHECRYLTAVTWSSSRRRRRVVPTRRLSGSGVHAVSRLGRGPIEKAESGLCQEPNRPRLSSVLNYEMRF
jgi:hypothetical protein